MNRIKHFFISSMTLVILALLLHLPYTTICNSQEINSKENPPGNSEMGEVSFKEEVVYGKLDYNGRPQGIYIVNILDVTTPGRISDYGKYQVLKNLTNLHDIESSHNSITTYADEGKFYYQGNLQTRELPWEITMVYKLDEREIPAAELAGQAGNLNIEIASQKNEKVNPSFFENYMLQFSITLDTDKCKDIVTEEGLVVNSGGDKIINYTLMPNTEGYLNINTNVNDFTMDGIEISAAPFALDLELPDTSGLNQKLNALSTATKFLSEAASELKNGMDSLSTGARSLREGSAEYKSGIERLDRNSSTIIQASYAIKESIDAISNSLPRFGNRRLLNGLNALASNYAEFHEGLRNYTDGVSSLAAQYNGINSGIISLADGTNALANGAGELSDGLANLNKQTEGIPNQISTILDDSTSNLDTSDYRPVSFVSDENKNVRAVQFILTTDPIQKESSPDIVESIKKETFWDRLKKLFWT